MTASLHDAFMFVAFVCLIIGIPWILKLVPPFNGYWSLHRDSGAYASTRHWYIIHRNFGWGFVIYSAILISICELRLLNQLPTWLLVACALLLLCAIIWVAERVSQHSKLNDSGPCGPSDDTR